MFDASALLAAVLREPGGDMAEELLRTGGCVSTVNLAEALSRLLDIGFTPQQAEAAVADVACEAVDFDELTATLAARLREPTRSLGLSLGDRACLALASHLALPAVTADRAWRSVDVGVEIILCR